MTNRNRKRLGALLSVALLFIILIGDAFLIRMQGQGKLVWMQEILNQTEESPEDLIPEVDQFLIYDLTEDYVVKQQGTTPVQLASTAKLFFIARYLTAFDMDEVISVDAALHYEPYGSSTAHLVPGDYHFRDLLEGMLLPSGNDCALALADAYARKMGNPDFTAVQALEWTRSDMETYYRDKGYGVHFKDVTGFYDAEAYLMDVVRICEEILEEPTIREIIATPSLTKELPNGDQVVWKNTNKLIQPSSRFFDPTVYGMKTGSLPGYCNLVALTEKDGQEYLVLVYGASSDSERYLQYEEIKRALD